MSNAATTLILRFRDLVTALGGTIESHQELASNCGHVWWGWWHKSGETVPDEAFRQLNRTASSSPSHLKILMLDSGRNLVFSATCLEIHWDKDHKRIPSPQASETPPYYSSQNYLAWFKLCQIEQVPESDLQKYSYVCVDEFFEDGNSRYSGFYKKRVHDADELRQQDRTIWFLRDFHHDDHLHAVRLLNGNQLAPRNFDSDFSNSKSLNLLWVSDLHFSDENHAFPSESTASKHDLGQAIEVAAKFHGITDFAGVLVSGDITWRAAAHEFELARRFFTRVATSPSKLDNYRFAIVPGNHDLKFSDAPENPEAAINDLIAPSEARAEFAKMYKELFYLSPNAHLSSGRRLLLGGSVPVEIVCLNSSVIEQKKGWYQGHGFVGHEQLEDAAQQMSWTETRPNTRPFRIAMLHHHLMPVTYRETPYGGYPYSVVFDAEALVQWVVANRVDLVVHGHMHEPFCSRISKPIGTPGRDCEWHTFHVVGMGSSGVAQSHRTGPNTFGVLQFGTDTVEVSIFSVDPTQPSEEIWRISVKRRT
jgi:hypothetical protein